MTARTYRRKSAEIQAIQWTGENADEVTALAGVAFWPVDPEDRVDDPDVTGDLLETEHSSHIGLENGDWILRDGDRLWALNPRAFADNYETAEENRRCADDPHPPGGYISTSCRHADEHPQLHARCRLGCKWCQEPCRCSCHAATDSEAAS